MPSIGRHIVSYHYPCPDGIFAALAARQHFKEAGIPQVHFFPNKVFAPLSVKDMSLKVRPKDGFRMVQHRKCIFVAPKTDLNKIPSHGLGCG